MRYQYDLSVRFLTHPGQFCYLEQLRWMKLARRDLGCRSSSEAALPGYKIKIERRHCSLNTLDFCFHFSFF